MMSRKALVGWDATEERIGGPKRTVSETVVDADRCGYLAGDKDQGGHAGAWFGPSIWAFPLVWSG